MTAASLRYARMSVPGGTGAKDLAGMHMYTRTRTHHARAYHQLMSEPQAAR